MAEIQTLKAYAYPNVIRRQIAIVEGPQTTNELFSAVGGGDKIRSSATAATEIRRFLRGGGVTVRHTYLESSGLPAGWLGPVKF